MTNLFLYGTLRHPGLLELVAGRPLDVLAPEAARLPGYLARLAEGHDFPIIAETPGAVAEGLLLRDVGRDVRARLDYYELSFGYDCREVMAEVAGEAVPAEIYFPRPGLWEPGEAFSLELWTRDHWPLTRHSAREVMGYHGVLSGDEVSHRWRMIRTRAAAAEMAAREAVPCAVRSGMAAADVEDLGADLSHVGFFLLKTLHLRHRRFDGAMSEALEREVFIPGDAATVLPYDPVRDRVLLIEQFRMGPWARGDGHPWQLEPIAGRIDGGESAESSAFREAVEEAGLRLLRLEPVARYYGTPGYSSEMFHSFIGIADLPDGVAGLGGEEAEHEDIRSHVLSFEAAMALIGTGEANNGPLILSLLWLARERDRLRAEAGDAS